MQPPADTTDEPVTGPAVKPAVKPDPSAADLAPESRPAESRPAEGPSAESRPAESLPPAAASVLAHLQAPGEGLVPARARSGAARAGVAAAAGLVLSGSFAPLAWWWLAPLAVAGLAGAVRGTRARQAYGLGVLAGLAFLVPLLSWTRVPGVDAWLLLALYQALLFGLVGPLLSTVQRLPGWPVWVGLAWVAAEGFRDRFFFGGFPWGRLAFSQPSTPFSGLAAVGGAPLVSFAVAVAGGLLLGCGLAVREVEAARVAAHLAAATATGLVGLAVPAPAAGPPVRVAVVQGNVPRLGLDAFAQRRAVLSNHLQRTTELGARITAGAVPRPDLVIWPENSSDIDPFVDAQAASQLSAAARAVGTPLLVGAVLEGSTPQTVRNSGVVWGPAGFTGQIYVKRHPVPFGEYVPLRSALGKRVGRLALIPRDFEKGRAVGLVRLNGVDLADVICFEVAYDGLVRDAVRAGGEVLVVQTNNATFGRTAESRQQLAMAQLRAREHARGTVVAATSGISAVISPRGDVLERSAVFTPDVLLEALPRRTSLTVADRLGVVPESLLALGCALAVGAAAAQRRGIFG